VGHCAEVRPGQIPRLDWASGAVGGQRRADRRRRRSRRPRYLTASRAQRS
jgi:hypothetical protein